MLQSLTLTIAYIDVRSGIFELLHAARQATARNVNAFMTASYWEIGRRIVETEQNGKRLGGYGEQVIERLSLDLTQQLGRGFSACNLDQLRQLYLIWAIPQTVSAESLEKLTTTVARIKQTASALLGWPELSNAFSLPWSAYVRLLSVKDDHARQLYKVEALRGGWNVRQLDRQIGSQFYECTPLSKNEINMLTKGAVANPEDAISPDEVVKDPYVLGFLNFKDEYSETELNETLLHRLEDFLLELGSDFTFVGRQRRLRIDQTWYRVDSLFFHRPLRCLIIIDFKLSSLTHADVGHIHIYGNYAKEKWTLSYETPPVGLILCADKGHALARYALDGLPNKIMATHYKTVLPDTERCTKNLRKQGFCWNRSTSHLRKKNRKNVDGQSFN